MYYFGYDPVIVNGLVGVASAFCRRSAYDQSYPGGSFISVGGRDRWQSSKLVLHAVLQSYLGVLLISVGGFVS